MRVSGDACWWGRMDLCVSFFLKKMLTCKRVFFLRNVCMVGWFEGSYAFFWFVDYYRMRKITFVFFFTICNSWLCSDGDLWYFFCEWCEDGYVKVNGAVRGGFSEVFEGLRWCVCWGVLFNWFWVCLNLGIWIYVFGVYI